MSYACLRKAVFCLTAGLLAISSASRLSAQTILGAINGTVTDSTGAAVPDADVTVRNVATNLAIKGHTQGNGTYSLPNIPVGTYEVSFEKAGFEKESHTQIIVQGDRSTTVDGILRVGATATVVEVTATPLMNQTDTTNGYVVDTLTIENTPLGTGSFTQLAIMSPGVHADFLEGAGTNAGLGNQNIFANGNRDTSNSFSLNGVNTNNLFNGMSGSSVGENRFVLNTGESFGAGGAIQTSTSVYDAIGQALPTPPPDALQEVAVNAAMYDATQGSNSGAHISVLTKSGTNALHGSAWELFQNSDMNAAPFFYNASPAITVKNPFVNRNQYGATFGGPIKKDKLFYFLSYQGVNVADAANATQDTTVPLTLTNDRSVQGIINATDALGGKDCCVTAAKISPVALAMLQAKLPNGQYFIPTPTITNSAQAVALGYDAVVQGPNAQERVNQGIANIDYAISDKDRFTGRYYVQNNPTTDPFGAVGSLSGFGQQLQAGSQVGALTNTVVLSPALTWEQHAGFTRMDAFSHTTDQFTPSSFGFNMLGSNVFPQIEISNADPTIAEALEFGTSVSFGNGGMYQNQWEYGSSINWVKGRHTISVGALWDHTQLNIINHNTNTGSVDFHSWLGFVEGDVYAGTLAEGNASRYYRSDTVGTFINDNYKVRSNLTLTMGLRWDYDGPLTEKYGRLTAFNGAQYAYDAATDTITNSGLEIAGNGSTSLLKNLQAGFAPRIGIAWSPLSKITIRTGYGIYYDRGEFFSYLSPPAGGAFNGPFGVTLAPPYGEPIAAKRGASFTDPYGTTAPTLPPGTVSSFQALLPNLAQTASGDWPAGNLNGPFEFGGYDINNKLPYTQNWSFDIQYQFSNSWLLDVGYVGNHGTHEVLPIPFNQPLLATPQHPVNGQIYSYGGLSPGSACNNGTLDTEPLCPPPYYAGNAEVRVPYVGYDMNSVLYQAEGISNYNALQLQLRKRLSNGLQFTASYTWSHALDEQSGLGLFFTGNNPLNPKSNYATADFDQTHVFMINYSYTTPQYHGNRSVAALLNSWTISGQTVAQSGQPYSVYDYSGSVASQYYGTYDDAGNPIVPLAPGVSAKQAQLQGTTGVNPNNPVLNAADFAPQAYFLAPGQDGVPPCDATGCDIYESLFGPTGRNLFRGPFQVRFDMGLNREFVIQERFHLRFEADAFNIFNHPDFDTPNNDVTFFPYYEGPPSIPPVGSLGYIQHTIGSSRFLQLGLHLTF